MVAAGRDAPVSACRWSDAAAAAAAADAAAAAAAALQLVLMGVGL